MSTFNYWCPCLFIGLLIMSCHVMGWALVWAVGGPGHYPRPLSLIIVGLMNLTGMFWFCQVLAQFPRVNGLGRLLFSGLGRYCCFSLFNQCCSLAVQSGHLDSPQHVYGDCYYLPPWWLCGWVLWLLFGQASQVWYSYYSARPARCGTKIINQNVIGMIKFTR